MVINGNLKFHTLGSGELQNAVIEKLASDPTGVTGRIYYNTTSSEYRFYNGSTWTAFATGSGGAASQTEVDAIETSLGAMVNSSGVFQGATVDAAMTNVTGSTDIYDVLQQLDAAISGKDQLSELLDVTITASAANEVLMTTGANTWVNYTLTEAGIQALDAGLTSIAGLTTAADTMIYTTALDTYATVSTTSFGRGLLSETDAASTRTTLGLVIGTDVQAYDANNAFTNVAQTFSALQKFPDNLFNITGSVDATKLLAFEVDGLTTATTRTITMPDQDIDLTPTTGTFQGSDAFLTSIATLGTAANKMLYTTAVDTAAETDLSAYARTNILNVASELAFQQSVNLEIGVDVQAYDATILNSADIGVTVQAYDADLTTIAGLTEVDGGFLVGTGTGWTVESGATARTSMDVYSTTEATNAFVNVSGDTMDSAANLVFSGGGTITGLPTSPSAATEATSKQYVDNLVTSGVVWKDPIIDPNLYDIVSAEPVSPVVGAVYIAYEGVGTLTDSPWGGTTTPAVADNDVLYWNGTDWIIIDTLGAGDRFIVAGEGLDLPSTSNGLFTAGFRDGELIEFVSGDPNTFSNWTVPHDAFYQVLGFTAVKAGGDSTGFANDATVYALDVKVGATTKNILVTGSAAQTFTSLVSEMNTDLSGTATATLVSPDGHIHIAADDGVSHVTIIPTSTGGTDMLTVLTDFDLILGGNIDGLTVNTSDPDSAHYGHTYLYSYEGNSWTEITGPAAISAGVGLAYSGNVLNVNLGAGIVELPTDEVGIDLYDSATGAIILTSTGSDRVTTTGGKLHLLLNGSTLTQGASGLNISAGGVTGTELNTSVAGAGLAGGGGSALSVNVDDSSIEINVDTLQVKAAGITNTMLAGGITLANLATIGDGNIIVGAATTGDPTAVAMSGDVLISNTGVTSIGTGVIVNADISASAAIDFSKLAALTAGNIIVGNGTNVPTSVAMSGDVTLDSSGVAAIGTGVIVDADVNASAAIAYSKLNLTGSIVNADLVNSSITLAADTGTPETTALGDTLTIAGGTGIDTVVAATDTVTVSLNAAINDLSNVTATSTTGGETLVSNGTNFVNRKIYHAYDSSMVSEVSTITPVADVSDSLDGTYFLLSSTGVDYYFWINTSGGSATDPAPAGKTLGGEIAITTNDGVNAVATAIYGVVNAHAAFTAVDNTGSVTVTAVIEGDTTNAAAGTSGFTMGTTTEGGSPATSHVVTHNLGQQYCVVTIVDSTDQVIIPESITFDSTTQLTVTFNTAIDCRVIVMGVNAGA